MTDKVLTFLKSHSDFVSGEEMSKELGVTRASIWKNIKKLKEQGYEIESSTKKGYRLGEIPDVITKEEMLSLLDLKSIGKEITYFEEIDSTNEYAKAWAKQGAVEGSIVIADMQTKGKGRLGKGWISPRGTGIWMSLILRPTIPPDKTYQLTLLAGISLCKAIREQTGLDAKIKWPNDIVVNGQKVCGILTEMSAEVQCVHYVVMGVGMNVNMEVLDESIPYATSLAIQGKKQYQRKLILKSFLAYLEAYYEAYIHTLSLEPFLESYKALCVNIEKQVKVIYRDREHIGFAKDITTNGSLLVMFEDGREEEVVAGEVSVRGLYGYI